MTKNLCRSFVVRPLDRTPQDDKLAQSGGSQTLPSGRGLQNKHTNMALLQSQQVLEAIKRSSRPLICLPTGANSDHYASALGLAKVLKKLDKQSTIVAADGKPPKNIQFISGHEGIGGKLEDLRKFVIELDASKTKVDELSYEIKDEKLYVYLSPKNGFWDAKDVRTSTSGYRYDLIICIGSPDYESCAQLYSENPDFFYRTPIINIDRSPENEHYGQINIVDLTASSCGEVCHDLIESIESELIDEEVATAFLTGMIAKTKSFKTSNVTPKTLQTASKLIAKGAKRDHIVQNLYRTRSIPTLRLWGRALARLKVDEKAHIVWSILSQQDFLHAGTGEEDLLDVIDELIATSPQARVVVLIYENSEHNVCAIVRAERPLDAIALCAKFHAAGVREEVRLCFVKKNVVQVEKELIGELSEKLKIG
jgi:phosphoesterase RecJ-like protein